LGDRLTPRSARQIEVRSGVFQAFKVCAIATVIRHSRVATTTDVYQQVIPEGVADPVDSIHSELLKPRTAVAETRKIAAKLRAKVKSRSVRKKAKLAPIGAKTLAYPAGYQTLTH
jgi:hypothetical protein